MARLCPPLTPYPSPPLRGRGEKEGRSGLGLDQVEMLERAVEDHLAVAAQPLVEQGGVDAAEVGVIAQVARVEIGQARVLANQPALDRRPGDEQTRAGAVIGPLAAILVDTTAKLRERHG